MSEKDDEATQSRNLEIRERISNAYAAVEGAKATQSFAAYTLEDALDAQIERIEGAGTVLRPNQLARIDRVEADVVAAVAQIKAMPADAFVEPREDRDVNSKP